MPKTIIFLIIFAIGGLFISLKELFQYSISIEYLLFSHLGIGWLFFVFSFSNVSLTILSLWFFFKPRPTGFWIAISSWVYGFGQSLFFNELARRNAEFTRKAAIALRQIKGLSIDVPWLTKIYTQPYFVMVFWISLIGCTVFIALLYWQKKILL